MPQQLSLSAPRSSAKRLDGVFRTCCAAATPSFACALILVVPGQCLQALEERCNELIRSSAPVRAAAIPPGGDHELLHSPLLRGGPPPRDKVRHSMRSVVRRVLGSSATCLRQACAVCK